MSALAGRTAVVVGGATGIGRGLCNAIADRGGRVIVLDRDRAGGAAIAEAINHRGVETHFFEADITVPETLNSARTAILTLVADIDFLFLNAGATVVKPLLESRPQDWRWLYEVNLLGTVNCLQCFLPALLAQQGPAHLAVTASIAPFRPTAMAGQAIYNATKSAQFGLFNALEHELEGASHIALTTILPGPVATELRAKSREAYAGADGVATPAKSTAEAMTGDEAGEIILRGVLASRRYVTTHPAQWPLVQPRLAALEQAFTDPA